MPFLLRWTLLLLALWSGACSTVSPRVRVATEPTCGSVIEDRDLAGALGDAALASDRNSLNQESYNTAVRRAVLALQRKVLLREWNQPFQVKGEEQVWEITFDGERASKREIECWSPSQFDRILPADVIQPKGYAQDIAGPGIGVPFVLAHEDGELLRREQPYRPRNGSYVPGTATLEFKKPRSATGPMQVRLRFWNTYSQHRIRFAARERSLAYDVTAAVEMNLDNPYIRKNALLGLLRPDRRVGDAGLFGLEPYDPGKIPVVFVHGLKSDAHIWKNTVNEILADAELQSRYQPVLFLYPSGLSVPACAEKLRSDLNQYRRYWDPELDDPGMNRMVLVGHSMGGILSRLQVIDSGDDLRQAFFKKPLNEVPWLGDSQTEKLRAELIFEHQPFVKRVVFVTVPHRGSRVADFSIVQLAIRLIRLPGDTLSLATRGLTQDLSILNPALLSYHLLGLRSVDMLSPNHPYLKAITNRPIQVPYHSIIGDRGRGNTSNSSDGLVPYRSSHLDGAASELIVPYGHGCVDKPETVQEVMRILRRHAR